MWQLENIQTLQRTRLVVPCHAVGRSTDANTQIAQPYISRCHAEFRTNTSGLEFVYKGSNPQISQVNAEWIKPNQAYSLAPGDVISMAPHNKAYSFKVVNVDRKLNARPENQVQEDTAQDQAKDHQEPENAIEGHSTERKQGAEKKQGADQTPSTTTSLIQKKQPEHHGALHQLEEHDTAQGTAQTPSTTSLIQQEQPEQPDPSHAVEEQGADQTSSTTAPTIPVFVTATNGCRCQVQLPHPDSGMMAANGVGVHKSLGACTVLHLQRLIQTATGIRMKQQRLISGGRELQSGDGADKLRECGLISRSRFTVQVVIRSLQKNASVASNNLEAEATQPQTQKQKRKRAKCKYSSGCYRENAQHLNEFSHPRDSDWDLESGSESDDSGDPDNSSFNERKFKRLRKRKKQCGGRRKQCGKSMEALPKASASIQKTSHAKKGSRASRKQQRADSEEDTPGSLADFIVDDNSDMSEPDYYNGNSTDEEAEKQINHANTRRHNRNRNRNAKARKNTRKPKAEEFRSDSDSDSGSGSETKQAKASASASAPSKKQTAKGRRLPSWMHK
jgi:pSer/pThr/pTyr-binding forkhead associated (FHA) protein